MKRAALAVLLLLVLKVASVATSGIARERDLDLRADEIASRVIARDDGLVPASDRFGGEWRLVTKSMTALAFARLGKDPDVVRQIAEAALEPSARAFDTSAWGTDALDDLACTSGHAGYLGHLGLILASERLLGSHAHDAIEDAIADAIEIRLDDGPLVLTYPGEAYVPDNVVLAAALALHEKASGASERDRLARWVEAMRANVDPETGLLVFAPGQPARGSGAGWSSYFLPMIDADFAREQERALEHFAVSLPLGMAAMREGIDRGDVDSGPLVFGLSPSATAFAISGVRCSGNESLARGLERTAETIGTSVPTLRGRTYLFAPLVGDAILLAMRAGPPIGC